MSSFAGWWRRLARPWRWALLCWSALLLAYGVLCLATLDGSVNIAIDYRARMQEMQPVGPEDERSWPLIREAQSEMGEERLSLLREASRRPRIGFRFHPEMEEPEQAWVTLGVPGQLRGSVATLNLPHGGVVCAVGQDLAADMRAAVAEGDGCRAADDAVAILGLASQLAMPGSESSQQRLAWFSFSLAATAIASEVTTHPEAFADEDLKRLAASLDGIDHSKFRLDLTADRFLMDDLLQRLYTDDGNGDGSLTLEAAIGLRTGAIGLKGLAGPLPHWLAVTASPLLSMLAAPRAELAQRCRAHFDLVQVQADAKPWLRDSSGFDQVDNELEQVRGGLGMLRIELLAMLSPWDPFGMAIGTRTEAMTEAARLVVAAERYRRAMGRWPASTDDLVEQLNGQLPVDPWTGTPLHLGVVDGAIRVWSLGMDRTDEGGRPALEAYWGSVGQSFLHAGTDSGRFVQKGDPAIVPAPAPELISGWIVIPNNKFSDPIRGDWVLWPHEAPVIEASADATAELAK